MKPTTNENEYFARQEGERSRQEALERQAKLLEEDRERERSLHFMKCPKCGMALGTETVGDVRVDKCSGCEGIWLDKGELELIQKQEDDFMRRFLNSFRTA